MRKIKIFTKSLHFIRLKKPENTPESENPNAATQSRRAGSRFSSASRSESPSPRPIPLRRRAGLETHEPPPGRRETFKSVQNRPTRRARSRRACIAVFVRIQKRIPAPARDPAAPEGGERSKAFKIAPRAAFNSIARTSRFRPHPVANSRPTHRARFRRSTHSIK